MTFILTNTHIEVFELKDEVMMIHGRLHPDYEEEIKYFNENRVYCLQIESNLSCPQGCLYCYAASKNVNMKELASSYIMRLLDSAFELEIRTIDWLGGDPLVRNDWYELMKYAVDKNLTNHIWTSGIPLEDEETARKAVEVTEGGFISVHLDSLDERIYNELHSGDGGTKIKKILKGVDNVLELGKSPENMINCITFTNAVAGADVEKTIKYFFEEKGLRTCLTQMCDAGLASQHREWTPNMNEIEAACEARDKVNYPDSNYSIGTMDTNKFYCGGIICVTVDGDVTPCSVIRSGFGNIHQSSLPEIIEKNKDELLMTHLRNPDNLPGDCRSCEHNSVCWGCRATAYYEGGDSMAMDPKCWKNKSCTNPRGN